MKLIPLTGKYGAGKCAMVDDEDYNRLMQWKWFVRKDGYPARTQYLGGGRKCLRNRTRLLHREVLKIEGSQNFIDHIDCNKCNAQKHNLRRATKRQNCLNRGKIHKRCASRYKGVQLSYKRGNYQRWMCKVQVKGKQVLIGLFRNELHAAMAYDMWMLDMYGEFVKPNLRVVKWGRAS